MNYKVLGWCALALVACKKKPPPTIETGPPPAPPTPAVEAASWPKLHTNVIATEQGLQVPVPQGWQVFEPPTETGLTARWVHTDSQAAVDLRQAPTLSQLPQLGGECAVSFQDTAPYPRLPAFDPVQVAVCVSPDGRLPVLEAYTSTTDPPVRFEVYWPVNNSYAARGAVFELLGAVERR